MNTLPPMLVLCLVAAILPGCVDDPDPPRDLDRAREPTDASDDIIEAPPKPPTGAEWAWDDVETFDLTLDGPDDAASTTIDMQQVPTPSMLFVVVYHDCVPGAVGMLLDGIDVTVSAGDFRHDMRGSGTDCPSDERSRGDTFGAIALLPCHAEAWTIEVTGDGPATGAEVHVQKPAHPGEAQAAVDAFVAEHGDPCSEPAEA